MSFWETNCGILQSCCPALAEQLRKNNSPFEGELSVTETPSGKPSLLINGLYIHSSRFPEKEAEKLVSGMQSDTPALLLGFGLGYTAEAIAARYPRKPIIILEKHWSLFRIALENRDLSPLLSRQDIAWVIGGDARGILGALELFRERGNPEILANRNLVRLDNEWYGEAEAAARTWMSKENVNAATLRRFGKRWVRNLGANMGAIRDIPGIEYLTGIAGAFPVFLAAAGPSLDEIAPFLGDIAQRCIIIAVDTSLRFLLARGINPDFVVVVDPQYWNARHLDRCPAPESCLIAESAVYPRVLRHSFKRAFLCSSLFPLGRFIEDRVNPKGLLGAGGSVATTAWDFARILGAGEIWIAGLDLSFPGLKTHFRGALFEERAMAEATRILPGETKSVEALLGGRPFAAAAADGGKTLTDKRLSLYAAWFENRFLQYPAVRNRGFSPQGLSMKGLDTVLTAEILRLPPRRDAIQETLSAAFSRAERDFFVEKAVEERKSAFAEAKNELSGSLKHIISVCESAAGSAGEAWKNASALDPGKRDALLATLEEANRAISRSLAKDVAGFLFPPLEDIEKNLKSPPGDPFRRHMELSLRLYESLAEAASYNLRYLA